MVSEFVDGWTIVQTLGEGAYGEVKLLLNRQSGEAVAMKVVDLGRHPEARNDIRKEVCIHRLLADPHILRFFGHRKEGSLEYIFLEYASGGELFDRIEPDSGMEEWEAQKYWYQLLAGIEYLHSRGVAHRDLKPENLLLDEHDNLKISDFGMATIYRSQGKERCLEKRCGTLPYVAPEVLLRPYHAEPADIWACGIVLVAMLAGELPWDQPTSACHEYMAWKDGKWASLTPWSKLDNMVLSLLRRILVPLPRNRYTLKDICSHRWYLKEFSKTIGSRNSGTHTPLHSSKRICSGGDLSPPCSMLEGSGTARISHSQPEPHLNGPVLPVAGQLEEAAPFSFSQPAHLEDLLLNTQLNSTQSTEQHTYQKLVRRMTRFFVKTSCDESLELLCAILEKQGYSWKINTRVVTITSMDKRKAQLVFKSNVLDMDGKTLLDFRLSKGCGLEFKRRFVRLKECLGDIVLKGPVMWPIAIATNSVP